MSGHSKWANIKNKKTAMDQKRADVFGKLAKIITVAATHGGGDLGANYTLRTEVEKAKGLNMPKDKIEAAIKKGTGEDKSGTQLEELLMEAYGPGNSALLIQTITDNRNRTASEVKQILNKNNGKPVGEGGVRWMFQYVGVLKIPKDNVKNIEEFELRAIDAGAQDMKEEEGCVIIYTNINNLQAMQSILEKEGFQNVDSGLEWVAKDEIEISQGDQKKLEALFEALDENDDVQAIYSNTK